ncbi:hypothetical protein BDR04DRAFT_1128214 [Suillus decipiens]|nr:hypothetical protein BDR04DRAFT_1128214 [Suillus decipiens]
MEINLYPVPAGLLVFHVFCDAHSISEDQQGPASSILLAFIAGCARTYSGKTLEIYFYGIWAWHLLHGLPWLINPVQIASALQDGACLAPILSKCPKCHSFTGNIIYAIHLILDLPIPLDAAVFACLVISFFSLARLGEVTAHSLTAFHPSLHIKVSDAHYNMDFHDYRVTVLHLPTTKMSPTSEDLHHNGLCALTCSEFLCALEHISAHLNREPLKGSELCIGGTLEYLLCGVPFKTVKSMGHCSSDAFIGYLQQHAIIMAPYLQDSPILEPFMHYTMLPARPSAC